MIIEVVTARLLLRQWRDEDYEPFARLNGDCRVMEYFPSRLAREASDALADRCRGLIGDQGWGLWAVELRATGDFMGFVGLHRAMGELPFAPCVEVGWRLAVEFWGKGYATEGAKAALKVGFEDLALDEIVSFTTLQNERSRMVMRRLGMEFSGEFDHAALSKDSPLVRHCLYRLLRDEFLLRRGCYL